MPLPPLVQVAKALPQLDRSGHCPWGWVMVTQSHLPCPALHVHLGTVGRLLREPSEDRAEWPTVQLPLWPSLSFPL